MNRSRLLEAALVMRDIGRDAARAAQALYQVARTWNEPRVGYRTPRADGQLYPALVPCCRTIGCYRPAVGEVVRGFCVECTSANFDLDDIGPDLDLEAHRPDCALHTDPERGECDCRNRRGEL